MSRDITSVDLVGRYSNFPQLPKLSHIGRQSRSGAAPPRHPRIHNAQKRLGPEAVAELIADYEAGIPSTTLMAKYHLGKGTVLKILEDHGVNRRNQPLSPEQCTEAIELYLAGWSMAKVGRRYGRAHTVIRDLLKRRGITRT